MTKLCSLLFQQSLTDSDMNQTLDAALVSVPIKMRMRCLGFVLLAWFPALLHAQRAGRCNAPQLDNGYFVPVPNRFKDGEKLTYSCNDGLKPIVEGWWATVTCQNGKWSAEPQCIEETACFPPVINNGEYTASPEGWFKNGDKIRVTCNAGYANRDNDATARCSEGNWTALPVCERKDDACGVPPQIPHGVIISQPYQEVFVDGSSVQYECEDGYTMEMSNSNKQSISCISGFWDAAPKCTTGPGPDPGPDAGPDPGQAGGSSAGTGQPADGASTDSTDKDSRPMTIPVRECGRAPHHGFAYVERTYGNSYTYRCNDRTDPISSATVVCYSDKTWSKLPVCRGTCVLYPDDHKDAKIPGIQFLNERESRTFWCTDNHTFSYFYCTDGRITRTECCDPHIPYSQCQRRNN